MQLPKNLIVVVDSVKREMELGMPNGMTDGFMRKIPFLLRRIDELEAALVPFARAYEVNEKFTEEMVQVYKVDTMKAAAVMDRRNSIEMPKQLPEIPA